MKAQTLALVAITVVAVMAASIIGTWRMTRAVGPDVNNDGSVAFADFLLVLQSFGQEIPLAHKFYELRTNEPIGSGELMMTEYVDVRGCSEFAIVTEWTINANGSAELLGSMNGSSDHYIAGLGSGTENGLTKTQFYGSVGADTGFPYVRLNIQNIATAQQVSAFLYCTP